MEFSDDSISQKLVENLPGKVDWQWGHCNQNGATQMVEYHV